MTAPTAAEIVARCENCHFRHPDERPEYVGAGQCRRFPPLVFETVALDGSGANHFGQHWPWMAADEWCGEYSAVRDILKGTSDDKS